MESAVPVGRSEGSSLEYTIKFASGERLKAMLYLVYATPQGEARGGKMVYMPVTRDRCKKACSSNKPIMAGIYRGRTDSPSTLHVSIDEASTHVRPGPGNSQRFRLLLAAWQGEQFAGSAVSQQVRVIANNDVPRGAGFLRIDCTLWQHCVPSSGSSSGYTHLPDTPNHPPTITPPFLGPFGMEPTPDESQAPFLLPSPPASDSTPRPLPTPASSSTFHKTVVDTLLAQRPPPMSPALTARTEQSAFNALGVMRPQPIFSPNWHSPAFGKRAAHSPQSNWWCPRNSESASPQTESYGRPGDPLQHVACKRRRTLEPVEQQRSDNDEPRFQQALEHVPTNELPRFLEYVQRQVESFSRPASFGSSSESKSEESR